MTVLELGLFHKLIMVYHIDLIICGLHAGLFLAKLYQAYLHYNSSIVIIELFLCVDPANLG